MKSSDHGYFAQLTYDLRVRERLLAAGIVAPADIERYLSELTDLEAQSDSLGIDQPALGAVAAPSQTANAGGGGGGGAAAAAAPAPTQSAPAQMTDGSADNDDDDDDDDESETT